MKDRSQVLEELQRLVREMGPAWVAVHLGYRTGDTISKWVARKNIPHHKLQEVERLLKRKTA